jgi:hypothetical protein
MDLCYLLYIFVAATNSNDRWNDFYDLVYLCMRDEWGCRCVSSKRVLFFKKVYPVSEQLKEKDLDLIYL